MIYRVGKLCKQSFVFCFLFFIFGGGVVGGYDLLIVSHDQNHATHNLKLILIKFGPRSYGCAKWFFIYLFIFIFYAING